ncbi:MAG TPA: glycosyltransferase [Acidimicrobiia bacterium]
MSSGHRPRVTLVTSNGWGLGHLSRQLAIALAMGDRADVTLFSFSRALPLAEQFGIRSEFCPSHSSPWVPRPRWNKYVERRFDAFLTEVGSDVVLFDGVAPYPGIINALMGFPTISAGWLRRGMWLRGRTEVQLAKASAFDFVIEPGDIASPADTGPTARLDSIRVPPVSLLEVVPMLDRDEAAAALSLDPARPSVLFGIGSGQPGEAADARQVARDQALHHSDWQVGTVSSPLSTDVGAGSEHDVPIRGVYPLMRYLTAFDAAISAAGYNSVHELIPAGVPSLFVPKSASQTDDQIARATYLADHDLALVAMDHDLESVRNQVERLLGGDRTWLQEALAAQQRETMLGGARAVAGFLTDSPPIGVRETGREEWRQPGFKGLVKRAIGPKGVEVVQRALGRVPKQPPRNPVSLHADPPHGVAHLVVSQEVTDISLSNEQPVEHVLTDTSPAYMKTRLELIDEFYDVVG